MIQHDPTNHIKDVKKIPSDDGLYTGNIKKSPSTGPGPNVAAQVTQQQLGHTGRALDVGDQADPEQKTRRPPGFAAKKTWKNKKSHKKKWKKQQQKKTDISSPKKNETNNNFL